MSDQPARRPSRRTTAVLVGVLIAVIVVVTVIGLITAAALPPASSPTAAGVPAATYSTAPSPAGTPAVSATATPTASATEKPEATATTAPSPQVTKSVPITESTPAAIKKELSVRVTKMEAITGTADGPGEVSGPSVRFTIRIDNTTGASVNLSNTVVNAYIGVNATPAIALQSPGGRAFPASVADGGSATGVFVFNIPKAARSTVQVTVDTSVNNPVIAFKGSAPTS